MGRGIDLFIGIKDFRANDHEYSVAGEFSDGVEIERCYVSSSLVESFLGVSPSQCASQLNAAKDKARRKEMKKEICYRFLSFQGTCDVTALKLRRSAHLSSEDDDVRYTITSYHSDFK